MLDFDAILHYSIYILMLTVLPLSAVVVYYMMLLHQAVKNEERYTELRKHEGSRRERLRRMEEQKRLADPFFHFNVTKARNVDELVDEKLGRERRSAELRQREQKIVRAVEAGRLIILDTAIDDCAPGMVIARPVEELDLRRGDELDALNIDLLRQHGFASLPILYNPNRVAGALSGAAA